VGSPELQERFNVNEASYDEAGFVLALETDDSFNGDLRDFVENAEGGTVSAQLIPRFFRIVTNGVEDALPDSAFVRIRFQAARADPAGNPDEANLLLDWTGDVSQFNQLAPGAIQFFRFEVEFELDALSQGITIDTEPIEIDFLRVPFRF
jgi:hypothetical protein